MSAPASIRDSASSFVFMPPEALTFKPYGFMRLESIFIFSTVAPKPFLANPVEVLTKSTFCLMHISQPYFISTTFK